jgi:hypothetical protein
MERRSIIKAALLGTALALGAATLAALAADAPVAQPSAVSAVPAAGSAASEAQRFIDGGDYKKALEVISKELASERRGTEATTDRHILLNLKGEALFRLGENSLAIASFQKAAEAAGRMDSPDVKFAATARANALLAKASPKHIFKPPSGEPIDVANPAMRIPAFAALHEALAKQLAPKIAAAKNDNTLPPMFQLLPQMFDLGSLEYAAKGAATETTQILQTFGQRARELINGELQRLTIRIQHTGDMADSLSGSGGNWNGYIGRRGLTTNERKALEEDIKYLGQIEKTAVEARNAARQLGFTGEKWDPIIQTSVELINRATTIREAEPS